MCLTLFKGRKSRLERENECWVCGNLLGKESFICPKCGHRQTQYIFLMMQAEDFLDTFKLVNTTWKQLNEKFYFKFFLVLRSVELVLKSYLSFKGYNEKRLKNKIGHSLKKALKYARKEGIENIVTLDKDFIEAVNKVSNYYRNKEFEYPRPKGKDLYGFHYYTIKLKELLTQLDSLYRQEFRKRN